MCYLRSMLWWNGRQRTPWTSRRKWRVQSIKQRTANIRSWHFNVIAGYVFVGAQTIVLLTDCHRDWNYNPVSHKDRIQTNHQIRSSRLSFKCNHKISIHILKVTFEFYVEIDKTLSLIVAPKNIHFCLNSIKTKSVRQLFERCNYVQATHLDYLICLL